MKTKQTLVDQKAVSGNAIEHASRGSKQESKRTAWMGGLDTTELARPGGILIAMLTARANELGHQLGTMAEHLNCTYGYISQLRGGVRQTSHISDEFATACALYLGVPRMTVLMAAGRVRPEDVYEDPHETMAAVPRALQFMQDDPHYGPRMPREVFEIPLALQFFIVQLYEGATNRKLLPGEFDAESVAREIKRYQDYRLRVTAEVDSDRERKAQEAIERQEIKSLSHAGAETEST